MSGGSYDYGYTRIDDLADQITATTPLRKAFKKHLHQVAQACHDIEWVDSGDSGSGDEDEAICACLGKAKHALVLAEVLLEAKRVKTELDAAIESANTAGEGRGTPRTSPPLGSALNSRKDT